MKTAHPADHLLDAIDLIGSPVCVGLDPVVDKLPLSLRSLAPIAAISAFSVGVVKALKGIVPCVKLQSACYERFGPDGLRVLEETMSAARETGLVTILDAKRGDIGISAEHYSCAMYGQYGADWSTVNAYLGMDGITPFLARGGAFALVRTSNPAPTHCNPFRRFTEVPSRRLWRKWWQKLGNLLLAFGDSVRLARLSARRRHARLHLCAH